MIIDLGVSPKPKSKIMAHNIRGGGGGRPPEGRPQESDLAIRGVTNREELLDTYLSEAKGGYLFRTIPWLGDCVVKRWGEFYAKRNFIKEMFPGRADIETKLQNLDTDKLLTIAPALRLAPEIRSMLGDQIPESTDLLNPLINDWARIAQDSGTLDALESQCNAFISFIEQAKAIHESPKKSMNDVEHLQFKEAKQAAMSDRSSNLNRIIDAISEDATLLNLLHTRLGIAGTHEGLGNEQNTKFILPALRHMPKIKAMLDKRIPPGFDFQNAFIDEWIRIATEDPNELKGKSNAFVAFMEQAQAMQAKRPEITTDPSDEDYQLLTTARVNMMMSDESLLGQICNSIQQDTVGTGSAWAHIDYCLQHAYSPSQGSELIQLPGNSKFALSQELVSNRDSDPPSLRIYITNEKTMETRCLYIPYPKDKTYDEAKAYLKSQEKEIEKYYAFALGDFNGARPSPFSANSEVEDGNIFVQRDGTLSLLPVTDNEGLGKIDLNSLAEKGWTLSFDEKKIDGKRFLQMNATIKADGNKRTRTTLYPLKEGQTMNDKLIDLESTHHLERDLLLAKSEFFDAFV